MVTGFFIAAVLAVAYTWLAADNWNSFWFNVGPAICLFGFAGVLADWLIVRLVA
jgi:hypothetical protein